MYKTILIIAIFLLILDIILRILDREYISLLHILSLFISRFKNLVPIRETDRLRIIGGNVPAGINLNVSIICYSPETGYTNIYTGKERVLLSIRNADSGIIESVLYAIGLFIFTSQANRCYLAEYDIETNKVISSEKIANDDYKYEDMRLISLGGKLYGTHTITQTATNKSKSFNLSALYKIGIYDFSNGINYIPRFNYEKLFSQKEKNWIYFEDEGLYRLIYYANPLRIYETHDNFEIGREICNRKWSDKSMRLSTPPILIGDRWYMLIHDPKYSIYFLTFDRNYVPRTISSSICEADKCRYNIYFPCGCIWDATRSQFIITLGINDMKPGIMRISRSEVDGLSKPV